MSNQVISSGTVHQIPEDLKSSIASNSKVSEIWESLTPLGRNEFICWVEDAKQETTRVRRIKRASEEMLEGKRRPCCWLGCIHRDDKEISPSVKGILERRKTKLA